MVILDIEGYINEADRKLNDTNNYAKLNFDPNELHTEKIKSEINNLKNESLLILKTENSLSRMANYIVFDACTEVSYQDEKKEYSSNMSLWNSKCND